MSLTVNVFFSFLSCLSFLSVQVHESVLPGVGAVHRALPSDTRSATAALEIGRRCIHILGGIAATDAA